MTVAIKSFDRSGLLRDITALIDGEGLFITALSTGASVDGIVTIEIVTDIPKVEQLSKVLARMRQIPNVIDVWRVKNKE